MKKWLAAILMGSALLLAACGDKDEKKEKEYDAEEAAQIIEDGTVGFEMADGNVEEAKNIPDDMKKEIEAAFTEYVDAFNAKDIDRYMATISEKPVGFDYEEEKAYISDVFKQYDIVRKAEDVTILKYSKEEAQVFSNLSMEMVETATGSKLNHTGRQVTVFVKENGQWKVTSIYFIGNEANTQTGTESESKTTESTNTDSAQ